MYEQITKNQHYIPQFYLRNFSDNKSSVGMYILNKKRFAPEASIKKNFSEDFLYGKDNVMENNLMKLEGIWSEIISNILINNETEKIGTDYRELSYRDKNYLLMFIAVSASRTLAKANYTNDQIDGLYKSILQNEPSFEKYKDSIDDFMVKFSIPNWIPIETAKKTFMYFIDLHLVVLNNYKNCGFISSDAPVIKYDNWLYKHGYKHNIGLTTKGLQIFLPISRNKCLYLYDSQIYKLRGHNMEIKGCEDDKQKIEKIFYINLENQEDIEVINRLTIKNAEKFLVIHNQKDYENCKALIEHENNGSVSKGKGFAIHKLSAGEILQFSDPNVKEHLELPFCSIIDNSLEQESIDPNMMNNEELERIFPKFIDKFMSITRS